MRQIKTRLKLLMERSGSGCPSNAGIESVARWEEFHVTQTVSDDLDLSANLERLVACLEEMTGHKCIERGGHSSRSAAIEVTQ